MSHMQT